MKISKTYYKSKFMPFHNEINNYKNSLYQSKTNYWNIKVHKLNLNHMLII